MTVSVNVFTRYRLQRVLFPSCASLSPTLALRLSMSARKCVPQVVGSHTVATSSSSCAARQGTT